MTYLQDWIWVLGIPVIVLIWECRRALRAIQRDVERNNVYYRCLVRHFYHAEKQRIREKYHFGYTELPYPDPDRVRYPETLDRIKDEIGEIDQRFEPVLQEIK
jgi:hypothetical protein